MTVTLHEDLHMLIHDKILLNSWLNEKCYKSCIGIQNIFFLRLFLSYQLNAHTSFIL